MPEVGGIGHVLEDDQEARLLGLDARRHVCHAVVQGVQVMAEVRGERKGVRDRRQYAALVGRGREVDAQQALIGTLGGALEGIPVVGGQRQHGVRRDVAQRAHCTHSLMRRKLRE